MSQYETCLICKELYRCEDSFAEAHKMHSRCYAKLSPLEQCKAKIDAALREFDAELSISAEYKLYSDDATVDDFFIKLSVGNESIVYNGKEEGE